MERISDASVTVATLEILKKYKDRFLEFLEADSSTQNKQTKEAERSLNDRIREIQEFQDLRTKLLSFIHMCELIQPGENKTEKKKKERRKQSNRSTDQATKSQIILVYMSQCKNCDRYSSLLGQIVFSVLGSSSAGSLLSYVGGLLPCQSAVAYLFDVVFSVKEKKINIYMDDMHVGTCSGK